MIDLAWLPEDPQWRTRLKELPEAEGRWEAMVALARTRMDFVRTTQIDKRLTATSPGGEPILKIALLSSSTVDQLVPGLRVAALRRGIRAEIHVPDFGQYRQAVLDPGSAFHAFAPDVVIFSLDSRSFIGEHVLGDDDAQRHLDAKLAETRGLWEAARGGADRLVIQQALLPVFEPLLGAAERRMVGSPAAMVTALNAGLRNAADEMGVDVIALDDQAMRGGLAEWYAPAFWHRAKQEISPSAAPFYGELVMRIIDARRGRSAKCLVLDLDNTLWGGVIGDDGLENIVIGQGSAEGEAFVAFQTYAKALTARGILLAVCSKNDEAIALEPFEKHADMVLRRSDIACFIANWDDKASNLRRIAAELNIGIDSLVFADDNPFERNIVRRELPMVAVPELPEDPTNYAAMVAAAGYFEGVGITDEDRARARLYQADTLRRQLAATTTDLAGYLASLDMQLIWGRFDAVSIKRVTQLANKTNQFNLTTRRYTEGEIERVAESGDDFGLHLRLTDRFADHGIIAVVIGRRTGDAFELESWLMSCRVLGRKVEEATLAIVAEEARRLGATRLIGHYVPTAKNGMVREHYPSLGFTLLTSDESGTTAWEYALDGAVAVPEAITTKEEMHG